MDGVRKNDTTTVERHDIGGEFRGDFTRYTFDPRKHYLRVLMQQGRVLLDSDFNEQTASLLHYTQTLAADLIGPHGGPEDHCGFEIISTADRLDELKPLPENVDELKSVIGTRDFVIGKGRYYVDGMLCENEQYVPYTRQPHLPRLRKLEDGRYFVLLDVWERHITSNEDDSIREVALGGPDTATRSALIWQVIAFKLQPDDTRDCDELLHDTLAEFRQPGQGKLSARTGSEQEPGNDCTVSPESRYRGTENQLYRVEIHGSEIAGSDTTFVWSRDNSSIAFPIVRLSASEVEVKHLGKDGSTTLKQGNWVEVVDDYSAQLGRPGPLFEVDQVDSLDLIVRLKVPEASEPPPAYDENSTLHPLLRRWDSPGAVGVTVSDSDGDNWIALENGIEIRFHGEDFKTGDYWLIPARTATGDIEWAQKEKGSPYELEPVGMPPHGVTHHYAPLAIVVVEDGRIEAYPDCRYKFRPLGERSYTYRRKRGRNIWHFCSNCSNWPDADFDKRVTKPATSELCNQCRAKQANNECRTDSA